MATSGTFTGSRSGGTTGPRLLLDWSRVETDISGNRSKIRLTLKLDISGRINFSTNKTGSLHGSSFTFTGGINASSTTRTLQTRDVWVNHNSDGSKSQSFSASFKIDISYSGTRISSLSVSGNAAITAIPRASGFTAFSLSNTTVNTSTANTVTYTLDRKASGFSHNMTLKLGNKSIKSWSDSGTGARTSALTAAQVNEIIKGRPNNTSGTLTLTMQTRSGNTNIGSSVSRTREFSISTDVKPSASGITAKISGSGRDKTINRFVQNITKVESKFTSSAGYGAKVSSRSIVVRRVSGKANSQTISGGSGTTGNAVSLNGTYEAIGTIKDSRGRSATSRITFKVEAYSNPKITKFTAVRNKTTPTTVNITRTGSWSSLGTGTSSLNNITISVQRRLSTSTSWSNVVTNATGNTGSFTGNVNSTSNSEASSYEFRVTITDTFGKKATSTVKVGTSFVELTIAKGKGIGVGKVWERGALDVKGNVYVEGDVEKNSGDLRVDSLGGFTAIASRNNMVFIQSGAGEVRITEYLSSVNLANLRSSTLWADNINLIGNTIRNDSSALYIGNGSGSAGIGGGNAVVRIGTSGWRGEAGVDSGLMYFGRDGAGERIWSNSIYDRTYGSAANMHITGEGTIGRSTSARKYKVDEQVIEDPSSKILDVYAKDWYDKGSLSRMLDDNTEDEIETRRIPGVIAEDLIESGLEQFVTYGKDGDVEGVMYDRLWILLIDEIRKLRKEVNELKGGTN